MGRRKKITGSIEIKRVFYQEPIPLSARYLDPYDGFGFGGAAAAGLTDWRFWRWNGLFNDAS